jgi:capsule polysaccharide export protein KpsE/RkpR
MLIRMPQSLVADLEAQPSNLKTKQRTLVSYQSLMAPKILKIDSKTEDIKPQIIQKRAWMGLTSRGALDTLSSKEHQD